MTKSKQSGNRQKTQGKVRKANPSQRKGFKVNKIAYPLSVSKTVRHTNPRISSDSSGILRISHKEYIKTEVLEASAAPPPFYVFPEVSTFGSYDVNPGFPAFLPWGSDMAKNWERYRFHKLLFHFVPKQPTTAGGNLVAFFDYDFDDNPATSKQEFLTNQSSETASTFELMSLRVDPSMLSEGAMNGGWRFVSNAASSSATESRETMAGFLMIAVDSAPVGCTLSWDVWVEYDLELKTARPSGETAQGVWMAPVDEEGVPDNFILQTRSPATGSYVKLGSDAQGTTILQSVGKTGTVLGEASSPFLAEPGTSPRPWHAFRLLKEVNGGLEVNVTWNPAIATGGTVCPSSKGSTNQWELRAYPPNSATVDDWIAKCPEWSQYDGNVYSNTTMPAAMWSTSDSNPSSAERTTGMKLSFAVNQAVWGLVKLAGLRPEQTLFGLVNVGDAVMASSVIITGLAIRYMPFLYPFHRAVAAPYMGRRRVTLKEIESERSDSKGHGMAPQFERILGARVPDQSAEAPRAGLNFAPAGHRLL